MRENIPPSAEVFSDGSTVFLYYPKLNHTPARSLALRGRDGLEEKTPSFMLPYEKRKEVIGRNLLLEDTDAQQAVTMRLYDVQTGQDVWKQTFAPKAVILHSLVRQTVGAIDPDGRLRVFELPSGQLVLQGYLPPSTLKDVKECHLLRDTDNWYILCNRHPMGEPGVQPVGTKVLTMLRPATTLSTVFVDGPAFAFERSTGRTLWQVEAPKQC